VESKSWGGDVPVPLEDRIATFQERLKRQREERIATFKADGGDCTNCFDEGPCSKCERGRTVRNQERIRARDEALREVLGKSNLPPRFRHCTFDGFPGRKELADQVRSFVESWDRRQNLLLIGKYGTGKTGLLAASVNALIPRLMGITHEDEWSIVYDTRRQVLFWSTPNLFDDLRAGYSDGSFAATMRDCQRVPLLILDDLGAEKPTEWVLERLYAIVNHRYEHDLPTWASTNLTPGQLTDAIGERVWSRLQEDAYSLVAAGRNLRQKGAA
jgi:DNA replication protein DnaC